MEFVLELSGPCDRTCAKRSGSSFFNYLSSEPFAVIAAADMLPSFITLMVYPGYAVNDEQSLNVISHCPATLRYAPILAFPSLYTVPRHQLPFEALGFICRLLIAGVSTIFAFRGSPIRSMCKCMPDA